jgi:hypothetical protein
VVVVVATVFVVVAAIVEVILIAIVVAGANGFLAIVFAAEVVIHPAMFVEVHVGLGVVDDYFVTVIEIEVVVAGGQVVGEDPTAPALVDELMFGNVVVRFDVREIIILDMIVTGGAPGGLAADVDGKFDLRLCGVDKGDAGKDGGCQEVFFHKS